MGLELDEAVDDLDAGPLHLLGPPDVRLLVEARLELDQCGNRLSRLCSLGQRLDDRRIGRGPVERLLDRDHVGVARRLLQELHDDVETLIGMVDEQVLLADRGEAVAAVLADALGEAGVVGLELQIRPVDADELRKLVQANHAVDLDDLVAVDLKLAHDQAAQMVGHAGRELEPDDDAEPTLLQHRFEDTDEVLRLLLDIEVGVTDDPERTGALHLVTREELGDEQRDRVVERDEAVQPFARQIRQLDEAIDLGRHADQGVELAAVALALQRESHGKAEIRDEGERMRRVDRQRRQHREDVVEEVVLQPDPVLRTDIAGPEQMDPVLVQVPPQLDPACLLVVGQGRDRLTDRDELLRRRQTILAAGDDAGLELLAQARDADHEEFVEVVGGNREEAQLLEQRVAAVRRLLHDAAIELQPGQFAVDEAPGLAAKRPRRLRRWNLDQLPVRARRVDVPAAHIGRDLGARLGRDLRGHALRPCPARPGHGWC